MAEYKVKAVSPKVDDWNGQYGPMKTYYMQLEGEGEDPIKVNQKPDTPTPTVGQLLEGDIVMDKFGKKFNKAKKPFTPGTPSGNRTTSKSPEEQLNIMKQTALKAAVELKPGGSKQVIEVAAEFFAWLKGEGKSQVDTVFGETTEEKSGYDQAKETADNLRPAESDADKTKDEFEDPNEVDLSEVPF